MSSAPTVVTATDLERMHRSINKTLSTTSRSTAPDPSNEKSELRSRSLNKVKIIIKIFIFNHFFIYQLISHQNVG
jgi:hypothetical protein